MNGPMKMYAVKPVIDHDVPADVPVCMYKIRSFHSASGNGIVIRDTSHVAAAKNDLETFAQDCQERPDMTKLVERQESILTQLVELKRQMLRLKESLRNNPLSVGKPTSAQRCHFKVDKIPGIVINVSPSNPPYYLQFLQLLWADVAHLKVQCHVHSTVSSLTEDAKLLAKNLQCFTPKLKLQVVINVRVIWKEVDSQTELIIGKVPILGEVNILRYLARITSSLSYETTRSFDLDNVLDTCYSLVRSRTKTERGHLLQSLYKKLNKAPWVWGRSETTIADVAMYSALKQIPANEINMNMTKWLQKCETSLC